MKLLVVESPTKTKTLRKFLGRDFHLASTGGHVIDLPKSKLGIDIKNDFAPQYVTLEGKEKILAELKRLSKKASTVYLAPDPDREGEAIAYHVAGSIGKISGKVKRVTFNEITKKAVLEGIKAAGSIDLDKVYAQQARRILDRLVGYQVSPLLWKSLTMGLSAGRVQSVALRLICEREEEIEKFVSKEFWKIDGRFATGKGETLKSRLIKIDGKNFEIGNEKEAETVCGKIRAENFKVSQVKSSYTRRQSPPPFITSSLQQEAFQRLGFNNRKCMMIAQQLYEGIDLGAEGQVGLITYMRTDSFRIAEDARKEAKSFISVHFGKEFVAGEPKKYKARKGAQDAHEAIRPTSVNLTPEKIKQHLSKDQLRLYQLIWSRFVASQMADARLKTTSVDIEGGAFLFRAFHQELVFEGFLKVYEGNGRENNDSGALPPLAKGDALKLEHLDKKQQFTQPPPRFNAGSLVKELEEKGIGRPSTYAQIVTTLLTRKYIEQTERRFKPTDLGRAVNKILIEHFPDIFNVDFTAEMESELDSIEEGKANWVEVLRSFYETFEEDVKKVSGKIGDIKKKMMEKTSEVCDKCGSPMVIKYGRNGRFLACSKYPECRNTRPLDNEVEKTDKTCPNCGSPMVIRRGRFGRFIACSKYPDCKTTTSVSTGVKCPEKGCDGEIVERSSRKGRLFYSCSRYPKCKFSSWAKPIPSACPACGNSYIVERTTARGSYLSCPACKNRLNEPEKEPVANR